MRAAATDVPKALPLTEPLDWHPQLSAVTTESGQVILLLDGDSILFEPGPGADVARAISAHASVAEILASGRDVLPQARLQSTLDELALLDLAQPAEAHATASKGYIQPVFEAPYRAIGPEGGEIFLLADLSESDPLIGWAREVVACHKVAVALVDDELDPRLEEIDRRLRAAGSQWILAKLRGKRPSIGPWFVGSAGHPCWVCLKRARLRNQPVRRWLSETLRLAFSIPIAIETLSPELILKPPFDAMTIAQLTAGALIRIDPKTGLTQSHFIASAERCRGCGVRDEAPGPSRPLELQSRKRLSSSDGGYRSYSAEDTLERLSKHVSPVTGSVADVSMLPGHEADAVPIHRSALFTCPLAKTTIRQADLHRVALGKGRSVAQSRASALCEALERSVAQYRGDEEAVFAAEDALSGERVLAPPELRALSRKQLAGRAEWRSDEPIHWVDVVSMMSHEIAKAPLTFCYANTPFGREEELIRFDSNGAAAGRALEDALLQGLLEVIERDAVAIWWYNRISVPSLPLSVLGEDTLGAVTRCLSPTWDFWLLDVTADLDTPVCVAVARRREDGQLRLGFGCHLSARIAAERAATELCQLIAIGKPRGEAFDFAKVKSEPYLHPLAEAATAALSAGTEHDDIRDAILTCIERLKSRGLELFVHRYPAIDEALVVIKAMVPGMCHIWPQLGAPRLYSVPVERGWVPRPLTEDELNPLPLFV